MRITLKGSLTSGWYAPPRGTHSGEKHRAVGSGKAVVSKPAKKPEAKLTTESGRPALPLVDSVRDVKSMKWGDQLGTKGYYIRSDGKLVDAATAGGEHKDVMEKYPHMLGSISEFALQSRDRLVAADDWDGLMEWEVAAWDTMANRGVVRVRSTPSIIVVEGLSYDRAGIKKFQNYVLDGKLPTSKRKDYIWFPVGADVHELSWNDLMMAKYPRDLKDMESMFLRIVLRSQVPV